MADYDLGTAHGRIVIDYDNKGSSKADEDFKKIGQSSDNLKGHLSGLGNASSDTDKRFAGLGNTVASVRSKIDAAQFSISKMGQATSEYGQNIVDTTNKLASHIRILDKVVGATKAVSDGNIGSVRSFATLASAALGVNRELNGAGIGARTFERSLSGSASRISIASTLVRTLGRSFFGLRQNTDQLPSVLQRVIKLAAGIALFKASSGILLNFGNRFSIFRAARETLERLGVSIGGLATSLFPSLGAAGTETHRRFSALFSGIDGGITSFARLAFAIGNGIGAFRGFLNIAKLFGTVAKFAAIGASGIGVASVAATTAVHLLGTAFGFLGSVLNGAVKFVHGTGQALVQLSGAAGIIPGVIGAAGLAFGTLKLGLLGFSAALKTVGGDQKAFDEAVAKLAPSARETLIALRGFAPAFKDMQLNVQQKLFAGLGDDVGKLGSQYMPILYRGTEQVSIGLNKIAKGFTSFLGQAQTQKDTNRAFELTAVILGNVSKAVAPLAEALRDVAITGLEAFTHMTGGIEGASVKLRDFIANARSTGELRKFIEDGIQGFKDLGAILLNVGKITSNVFKAMGGDGSVGANVLAHVRELTDGWVKMTEHISLAGTKLGGLIDLVQAFYAHVERISAVWVVTLTTAFKELYPAVVTVSKFMEELSIVIGNTLTRAIEILGPLIRGAADAFVAIGRALLPIIGPIAALAIGFKVLQAAMFFIRPVVQAVFALAGAIRFIGSVTGNLNSLSNAFRGVGLATGPLGAVANAVGSLVTGIRLGLSSTVAPIGSFVRGFIDGFNGVATSANGFASRLGAGLNTAQAVVRTAMSGIVSGVSSAAGAVASAAGSVGRGVSSGFMTGANAAANAATSIALRLANGIASGAGAVSNAATSLAGRIAPAVIGAGAAVASAAQSVSGRIAVGISQAAGAVGGATGSVMNTVALGVASAGGAVASAATRLAGGIASGILAAGGAVSSAATSIGANVAVGLTSATGGVISAAGRLGSSIASGLGSATGAVGSVMGGIGRTITGAFSGIGTVVSSMVSGIGGAISGVSTAFASMAGAITISSRAISAAITTAFGVGIAGVLIAAIALFVNMSDSQKQVRATAAALKTENDALADSQTAVTKAFVASKGVINGDIYSGLNTQIDAVRTSLDSVGKAGVSNFEQVKINLSHIGDFMGTLTNKYGEQIDAQRKVAEVNAQAKASIDSLGLSTAQLGQIVGGTQGEFDQLENKLRGMGEGGALAADKLQSIRDKMFEARRSAQELSPGMVELADAIHKLAEGTGTAADKANLLKQAFDALHGKQASVAEANAQYNKSLIDVAEKSSEAIDQTKGFGSALVSADNSVNTATANGNALYSSLGTLVTGYQTAASAAYDASFAQTHNSESAQAASQAVYDKLTPALQQLGVQYGLTEGQIREMAAQMGAVPKEVNSQLAVQGGDAAKEVITQVQLALSLVPIGKSISITAPPESVINQLRSVGLQVEQVPGTKDVKVTATTQLALDQLNGVNRAVADTASRRADPQVGLNPQQFNEDNAQVQLDLMATNATRADPQVGLNPQQFNQGNAQVNADLEVTGTRRADPQVGMNPQQFNEDNAQVQLDLLRTDASHAEPTVGLNQADFNGSNAQVHNLLNVLDNSRGDPQARLIADQFYQGKNLTISALNDLSNRIADPQVRAEVQQALYNIQTVQNYLGGLQNKTINIDTYYVEHASTGLRTGASTAGLADGGVVSAYADGGIEKFASGGVKKLNPMSSKSARVVHPNTWRVVGDRVVNDEFFIPDTNQPQHVAIGAEWARRRGLALVQKFASGGYASAAAKISNGASAQINGALRSMAVGQSASNSAAQVQSAAQAALIGQLVLQVPQGVTAQQQAEEVMFAVRRAGKGVYS